MAPPGKPERCLRVALLGDPGTGQSAFLRSYRGDEGGQPAFIESLVASVELDGEPWQVRLADNLADARYDNLRSAALTSSHVILLCFAVDSPESLLRVRERWAPLLWAAGSEAPYFLLGLKADLREAGDIACLPEDAGRRAAHQLGALGYLECTSVNPETVGDALDEALNAAQEYYSVQWQLRPNPDFDTGKVRRMTTVIPQDEDVSDWLAHERLNVHEDPRPLDEVSAKQGLSMLGRTPLRQHAYLMMDLSGQSLTSVDAIRPYTNLQYVNVSGNQLRSLEPLGCLRCLLHLDASRNCLLRTQSFTAPEALETVDMSYNMIGELGDWGVHKYLQELNLRGNFIGKIDEGLLSNKQLRTLDLSENAIEVIQNLDKLGLRKLSLAQNQLASLEGVATLEHLQHLDVRHNNISSAVGLHADDVPRLRKLILSENRIAHVSEVASLNGFPYLCDLNLVPNPVAELPHYRAQVLHRLPRLRSLDAVPVPADEKVKADLIYGVDIDARKDAFEELLPQETFVDRRLVTEEGLADIEQEQFGEQGHAGTYGLAAVANDGSRSRLQDAKFRQRLEIARSGGEPTGVADFSSFPAPFVNVVITDEDVPEILEATIEGGVQCLMLAGAVLSEYTIQDIVSSMSSPGVALRHVDLSCCPTIYDMRQDLLLRFPFSRGCSLETADCGLDEADEERFRNKTAEAEAVLEEQAAERRRTNAMVEEYLSRQEVLEDLAAENCTRDAPPPPPHLVCHPARWREGLEQEAVTEFKAYRAKNPENLKAAAGGGVSYTTKSGAVEQLDEYMISTMPRQLTSMLRDWGCHVQEREYFDEAENSYPEDEGPESGGGTVLLDTGRPLPDAFSRTFSDVFSNQEIMGFMLWAGVQPDKEAAEEMRRKKEEWEAAWRERQARFDKLSDAAKKLFDVSPSHPGGGGGQLVAHFTYLSTVTEAFFTKEIPKPMPLQNFGLKSIMQHPRPAARKGQDLHQLLANGQVSITAVSGKGFGEGSVVLTLKNMTTTSFQVVIRQGSIFQHVDWQHRQNLMVMMDYVLVLSGDANLTKQLNAFCMNLSCACSSGNPMSLTDFYFDRAEVLESQGRVWDHFQGAFAKARGEK